MGRMPVPTRHKALAHWGCPLWAAWRIARRFHRLSAASGWVAYALRTRPPLSPPRRGDPARLACIRPAASVHPEPGSNSSLYYCSSIYFFSVSRVPLHPRALAREGPSLLPSKPLRPHGAAALCWPQTLKELAPVLPSLNPRSLPKAGAKVQPFPIPAMTFSKNLSSNHTCC